MEVAVPVDRGIYSELSLAETGKILKQKKIVAFVPPCNPVSGDVYIFQVKDVRHKGTKNMHTYIIVF